MVGYQAIYRKKSFFFSISFPHSSLFVIDMMIIKRLLLHSSVHVTDISTWTMTVCFRILTIILQNATKPLLQQPALSFSRSL